MSTLLYITANPNSETQSYGLTVGRNFIDAYKEANPNDFIVELDLYQMEIPQIDPDVFNGWGKLKQGSAFEELSDVEKGKVARLSELVDQFSRADKYVFVTPMWNFSVPPIMKAYIDSICVDAKTFKYTENGPVGLLEGKKAVHIQASGSIYSKGPANNMDFSARYVKAVLGFIGVTDTQTIFVEGMAAFPHEAERIKDNAIKHAKEVAGCF